MTGTQETYRDSIDGADWEVLLNAYYYSAAAVSVAGETGILGHNREKHVIGSGRLGVAATVLPAEPLVQELAGATSEEFDAEVTAAAPEEPADAVRSYYLETAIRLCSQASAVCDQVLTDSDATAYRTWVLELCAAVAYSAKEGGHFGIGGVTMSEPESAAIDLIAAAVGLPGWRPDPARSDAAAKAARLT